MANTIGDQDNVLIRYQGTEHTIEQLFHRLNGISNLRERYAMQVEIGHELLAIHEKGGTAVAEFFQYVQNNRAWGHLTRADFEKQWAETKKVVKRVRKLDDRARKSYDNVVKDWGPAAKRLMDGRKLSYAIAYRSLSLTEPNMDNAIILLNKAIMQRATHPQTHHKFDPTPQLSDLTIAQRLQDDPPVTDAKVSRFGLMYGELGLLEEQHGFVEGTLPRSTPPPQQSQTSKNEHSDARPSQPLNDEESDTSPPGTPPPPQGYTSENELPDAQPSAPLNDEESDTEMEDAPLHHPPPSREQSCTISPTPENEPPLEPFRTSQETPQTIDASVIEKDILRYYTPPDNQNPGDEGNLNDKSDNNGTDEDGHTGEEIDAKKDAPVNPEKPLPRSCSCSQDVPIEWTTEVDDLEEIYFKDALISLDKQQHFIHVCTKHQQKLAELLGLRELKKRELASVLQIIHTGRDDPWKLKTHASTYKYFLPDQRPKRVYEQKEAFRFPDQNEPYSIPSGALRRELGTKYPMREWENNDAVTMRHVLSWWQTQEGPLGYTEKTIRDVWEEEMAMYSYHAKNTVELQEAMRFSLVSQLLRQDPEVWRIAVALQDDEVYRLVAIPSAPDESLKFGKTVLKLPQFAVKPSDGENLDEHLYAFRKHDQAIGPGTLRANFVSVMNDLERTQMQGITMTDLRKQHLELTTGLVGRFPAALVLPALGAVSKALVGQESWGSLATIQHACGILERLPNSGKVYVDWQIQMVTTVIETFQKVKEFEQQTYGEESFFQWRKYNPREGVANINKDPTPEYDAEEENKYCL